MAVPREGEFYHHLVSCYGVKDMLDYQMLPDPVTGYYARSEREERPASDSSDRRISRPDFFLPEYDVYVEYGAW